MSFNIRASSNPQTHGKGTCFHVEVQQPSDTRLGQFDAPAAVMFDTYAAKPGITAALSGIVWINDAGDTDEGCYVSFANRSAEFTIVLPMSLANLLNAIGSTMEIKDYNDTGLRLVGSDIDAPDREDYEPNVYDGTYSEE